MNNTVTAEELRIRIESGENIILLDLRKQEDFEANPQLIPGAVKLDPSRMDQWEGTVPAGDNVVIYCARGGSISQSVQQRFKKMGRDIPYVEGGYEAWNKV